jgi:hypothetical protein
MDPPFFDMMIRLSWVTLLLFSKLIELPENDSIAFPAAPAKYVSVVSN